MSSGPAEESRRHAVYVRFVGANPEPRIETRDEQAGRYNYFLGSDPGRWRVDVPSYGEMVYRDLWPQTDLVLRCLGGLDDAFVAKLSSTAGALLWSTFLGRNRPGRWQCRGA